MFSSGTKHTKDSVRCLVIDIRHPIKTKSTVAEVSINKPDFLETVINKIEILTDGVKTIFFHLISNRFAMITIALTLALGGFFIASMSRRQLDPYMTDNASVIANIGSNPQSIYAQILELLSPINEAPAFISSFREFNKATVATAEARETLRAEWFSLIWRDGEGLISKLEKARNETKEMVNILNNIKNGMMSLGATTNISEELFTLQSKTQKEVDFLNKMIKLTESESTIAIFFVNNLEAKTTDKLIESYATIRFADGEVKDISVSDAPYPGQFADTKIIAQIPFVDINTNEDAKNISQFFNFLASAPKMLGFLETLPTYANQKIKFDGAIIVNYENLADILKITGPIKLPDNDIVFNQNNFLTEIQKELSKEPTVSNANRNNVLTSFISEVISKIQKMSEEDMNELTRVINNRIDTQDIQFYFVE